MSEDQISDTGGRGKKEVDSERMQASYFRSTLELLRQSMAS